MRTLVLLSAVAAGILLLMIPSAAQDTPYDDVISREVSVATPPVDDPGAALFRDVLSREFTVRTPPPDETNLLFHDAVSREFTVWTPQPNDLQSGASADCMSREFSVEHVDSAQAVCVIDTPIENQLVGTHWAFTGTARGQGFVRYRLQYGAGASPASWTTFVTSDLPVIGSTLGRFTASELAGATYTVRLLTYFQSGIELEDRVTLRLLAVSAAGASQTFISPNGDAVQDSTTLTATVTYALTWQAHVLDGGAVIVRQFSGTGTNVNVVWDGRDARGHAVADGVYSVSITASNVAGGVFSGPSVRTITVDNTLPQAAIEHPSPMQTVLYPGTLVVTGLAADSNFLQYKVFFGLGDPPGSYATLGTYTTPVSGVGADIELQDMEVYSWPSGLYTLKLEVTDRAGNKSQALVPVIFDYIVITAVSASPQIITPETGESVGLQFSLDHAADVTIRVYEWPTKQLVRTMTAPNRPSGASIVWWDGRNSVGAFSTVNRPHYWTIDAEDGFGRQGWYNKAQAPLMGAAPFWNEPTATNDAVGFDPYANDLVHASALMNGWALANISVQGTGLNLELSPSGVMSPGLNTVMWDGRMPSGQIFVGPFTFYYSFPTALPLASVYVRSTAERVADLRAEPYVFHPHLSEVTTFRYVLAQAGTVSLTISDPNGSFVRSLVGEAQTAGEQAVEWDGRDTAGTLVRVEGSYRVRVEHQDAASGIIHTRTGSVIVYR